MPRNVCLCPPWHTSFWSFINNVLKKGTNSTIQVVTLYILFLKWVWSWKSENICRFETQKLQSVPFSWNGHFLTQTHQEKQLLFFIYRDSIFPCIFWTPKWYSYLTWSFFKAKISCTKFNPFIPFYIGHVRGGTTKNKKYWK